MEPYGVGSVILVSVARAMVLLSMRNDLRQLKYGKRQPFRVHTGSRRVAHSSRPGVALLCGADVLCLPLVLTTRGVCGTSQIRQL